MDAKELLGGMALPHGVALLSRRRLALGYHDEKGALKLYTRELKGPTEGLLSLWTLISESLRALWKTYPEQSGARYVLAGALLGTLIGLVMRWAMPLSLPSWQMFLLGNALAVLMGLGLYYFYPPSARGWGAWPATTGPSTRRSGPSSEARSAGKGSGGSRSYTPPAGATWPLCTCWSGCRPSCCCTYPGGSSF